MEQSRIESFIESVLNVGSGFILSLLIWQYIAFWFLGYNITIGENIVLTSIFTFVSVARGYLWRRFFNAGVHKTVHEVVSRWVHG